MATAHKNLSAYDAEALYRPSSETVIALCVAQWNEEITEGLKEGALEVLNSIMSPEQILSHYVPGSFELALGAQYLFEHRQVDAVICIGSVIRGETAHFDYVCSAASQGILNVGLKYNAPCMFCVLTDDHIEQSRARSGGKLGNKGTEAAVGALDLLRLRDQLR